MICNHVTMTDIDTFWRVSGNKLAPAVHHQYFSWFVLSHMTRVISFGGWNLPPKMQEKHNPREVLQGWFLMVSINQTIYCVKQKNISCGVNSLLCIPVVCCFRNEEWVCLHMCSSYARKGEELTAVAWWTVCKSTKVAMKINISRTDFAVLVKTAKVTIMPPSV